MFGIEYQKWCDNVATDALSQVTSKLDAETMKSILDGVTMRIMDRADTHDPVVAKANEEIHEPVQEAVILAQAACIDLHVTDWVTIKQEDLILKTMIEWISGQKVQDPKHLLGGDADMKEGKTILQEQKKLTPTREPCTIARLPGELEEVLQFVVPKADQVAAMNGCHWDAGH